MAKTFCELTGVMVGLVNVMRRGIALAVVRARQQYKVWSVHGWSQMNQQISPGRQTSGVLINRLSQ